jgi:hypothetical protein
MNREEWLKAVADRMAPWYKDQGYSLPRFRIAIGFPSTGKRGKRIGECWDDCTALDARVEAVLQAANKLSSKTVESELGYSGFVGTPINWQLERRTQHRLPPLVGLPSGRPPMRLFSSQQKPGLRRSVKARTHSEKQGVVAQFLKHSATNEHVLIKPQQHAPGRRYPEDPGSLGASHMPAPSAHPSGTHRRRPRRQVLSAERAGLLADPKPSSR